MPRRKRAEQERSLAELDERTKREQEAARRRATFLTVDLPACLFPRFSFRTQLDHIAPCLLEIKLDKCSRRERIRRQKEGSLGADAAPPTKPAPAVLSFRDLLERKEKGGGTAKPGTLPKGRTGRGGSGQTSGRPASGSCAFSKKPPVSARTQSSPSGPAAPAPPPPPPSVRPMNGAGPSSAAGGEAGPSSAPPAAVGTYTSTCLFLRTSKNENFCLLVYCTVICT